LLHGLKWLGDRARAIRRQYTNDLIVGNGDMMVERTQSSGQPPFPPPHVPRGRIEVGVLRQWFCYLEAATDAIAVNPHPTLPLRTGRGD
jgi:hypothetical protein